MKVLISIILFTTFLISEPSEKLTYVVKYNGIKAGRATLVHKMIEDSNTVNIIFDLKPRKFFDFIYKLRENILIVAYKFDYSIKKIKKESQQGRYKKKYHATFDYINQTAYIGNKQVNLETTVHDPISIIYKVRQNKLFNNQEFKFNIISKDKIKGITMKVIGKEELLLNKNKYDCFILGPNNSNKDFNLKNLDEIKIWIDQDVNQTPIIIEKKAKHGIIRMELESINIINE